MAQRNVNDTQVAKVTQFIKDATTAIMATTTSAPGSEVVPLHFVRDAFIQHQHYILELHKMRGSLWLKELSVIWVPEKDAKPPGDKFCTIVTNDVDEENLPGCGNRGFYQVVLETSEDFECFVRLHVSRL